MPTSIRPERWDSADAYEPFVGRWSRLVARQFIEWLQQPRGRRWVDVGCGTGAVSDTILTVADPAFVHGIDPSSAFVRYAQGRLGGPRASFRIGDAEALPVHDAATDAAVSGLVLNFVRAPERAVEEMARIVRPGGVVGAFVWDYADKMEMIRYFWDAAVALDGTARRQDEGVRFSLCRTERLVTLFGSAGLTRVEARAIDVNTTFRNFEDYWEPFLVGRAPAPAYAASVVFPNFH